MPSRATNLVGIWFCPGCGWDSYAIILRPDGIGRAEFANCVLANAWVFNWQREDDRFLVSGLEAIELNEPQDDVVHLPWDAYIDVSVELESTVRENGQRLDCLRFGKPIIDFFPLEYGAGNPSYDLFSPPDFSWTRRARRSS